MMKPTKHSAPAYDTNQTSTVHVSHHCSVSLQHNSRQASTHSKTETKTHRLNDTVRYGMA